VTGSPPGRPKRLVVILGTGTDVGKTWVSCQILLHARSIGLAVAARKPVQSFSAQDLATGVATDADLLAVASGEAVTDVCPRHRWYPQAFAPPMAAAFLGLPPFDAAELLTELAWPPSVVDLAVVETAGGVRSPLAQDADNVDFAKLVQPHTAVLVADAGLGTINAVRLSVGALLPLPVIVFLNRFDANEELHRRNRDWLAIHDGLDLITDITALSERLLRT
jgi:dethiobiotin synthetase